MVYAYALMCERMIVNIKSLKTHRLANNVIVRIRI